MATQQHKQQPTLSPFSSHSQRHSRKMFAMQSQKCYRPGNTAPKPLPKVSFRRVNGFRNTSFGVRTRKRPSHRDVSRLYGTRLTARCAAAVAAGPNTQTGVQKYQKRSEEGYVISAEVEDVQEGKRVTVGVEMRAVGDGETPILSWGIYRSSDAKWYHPKAMIPNGSQPHKPSGSMLSSLTPNMKTLQYETTMTVPNDLLPVTFGCSVYVPESKKRISPRGVSHFGVPVGMQPGKPGPLGLQLVGREEGPSGVVNCSVNFAVVSRHAQSMSLCLVREGEEKYMELILDPLLNKTGDVWHICVDGLNDIDSLCYGWRATGVLGWEDGSRYSPSSILLDPYALAVRSVNLPKTAGKNSGNNGKDGVALLGCLSQLASEQFNWGSAVRPRNSLEDLVVCQFDLRSIKGGANGTFQAAKEKIGQFKEMGFNCVLLSGALLSDVSKGPGGLAPLSYFVPDHSLASSNDPSQASAELKELIKGLHENGIEVLMEVQYCFTGEGWDESPKVTSLRGLDANLYYRSGVLRCGHPIVRQLVQDSLRHWASNYQIDGFMFVNSETMAQDRDGIVQDNPALPESLVHDPILRKSKLVACVGDDALLPREGERGFPHWGAWIEWNKRFQTDIWSYFVEAGDGKLSDVATRVTGSADLFAARWDGGLPGGLAAGRRPAFGFNCSSPLVQTLTESVAQHTKKSKTKQGSNAQSKEGSIASALIVASLMFQGVPVLTMECLDDPILSAVARSVISFRSEYIDLVQPPTFDYPRQLEWHGAAPGSQPLWEASEGCPPCQNFIAYSLRSTESRGVYIAFNPHDTSLTVNMPPLPSKLAWQSVVDTSQSTSTNGARKSVVGNQFVMSGCSAVIMEIVPESPSGSA